jgi:hypothetical protein
MGPKEIALFTLMSVSMAIAIDSSVRRVPLTSKIYWPATGLGSTIYALLNGIGWFFACLWLIFPLPVYAFKALKTRGHESLATTSQGAEASQTMAPTGVAPRKWTTTHIVTLGVWSVLSALGALGSSQKTNDLPVDSARSAPSRGTQQEPSIPEPTVPDQANRTRPDSSMGEPPSRISPDTATQISSNRITPDAASEVSPNRIPPEVSSQAVDAEAFDRQLNNNEWAFFSRGVRSCDSENEPSFLPPGDNEFARRASESNREPIRSRLVGTVVRFEGRGTLTGTDAVADTVPIGGPGGPFELYRSSFDFRRQQFIFHVIANSDMSGMGANWGICPRGVCVPDIRPETFHEQVMRTVGRIGGVTFKYPGLKAIPSGRIFHA